VSVFEKLLIANRGEIACRVIRTARRLGIRTVAVYSDADRDALHVRSADEAVHIGPSPAQQSYLRIDALIEAMRRSGATAVHPGYGFLSENADFAQACAAAGFTFVGPTADAIRAMGSKIEAKRIVGAAGTPVVPGYQGDDQSTERLIQEAERIGYPVLIKASAGGGGKGMRRVDTRETFATSLSAAKREALAAFADDSILLERYLTRPKHIEVQVLADRHGRTLYLMERDCSVQRRHQKVIEEAPGALIDDALRRRMGEAAVAAARAIAYTNAGTIEFIVEDGAFYFMEMNTRLQVEHPVTEAILGLDLVEWQLRIAAGEPLPFAQEELRIRGHAIEARVYAENPKRRFLPSTGKLLHVRFPTNARVDTGVESRAEVTMHYDPMIAKVIASGVDRRAAIAALDSALADTEIAGVAHNVSFLRRVLANAEFVSGDYDTGLIDRHMAELDPPVDPRLAVAAALTELIEGRGAEGSPWMEGDAFRLNLPHAQTVLLRHGTDTESLTISSSRGARYVAIGTNSSTVFKVSEALLDGDMFSAMFDGAPFRCRIVRDGRELHVMHGGATERYSLAVVDLASFEQDARSDGRIVAPMPGQVIAVHVKVGDRVRRDQALLVLEAMKMEHTIASPVDGVVERLPFGVGSRVEDGAELAAVAHG
jgi:3-methylcrotonyl-CoA carboxylase alpha subunit